MRVDKAFLTLLKMIKRFLDAPFFVQEIRGIYLAFPQIHQNNILAEAPLAFQVIQKGLAVLLGVRSISLSCNLFPYMISSS